MSNADDPYLWLEDVTGERALAWVRAQNAISTGELEARPEFGALRERLLGIFNSEARIPYVAKHGDRFYNFWRDAKHVRGVWRRTTLEEYRQPVPAWETVLDLDRLAADEGENWVWKGYTVLEPSDDRALVVLSRGGADAAVVRELDLATAQFVSDGFVLPEAKSDVAWRDRDTVYVATDFGPGSLTTSGYPRIVKEWKRGRPLAEARVVFEARPDDVGVELSVVHDHGRRYEFIQRGITFFTNETLLRRGDDWVKLEKPDDATVSTFGDQVLFELRKDWTVGGTTYPAGALLAIELERFLAGARDFALLFEPGERRSLAGITATKNFLVVNELDNVKNRLYARARREGQWSREPLAAPEFGATEVAAVDKDESDELFVITRDFLTPTRLLLGTIGRPEREVLKSLPAFFDATGLEVSQHEARSQDGTRVPYFQVSRAGLAADGSTPTVLDGYGGFEISMVPAYSAVAGSAWLEQGGTYVLANIRGGGEFGPRWHQAARRENRQRAFDDFIAVAEDLIARKVTSPRHLAIQGGSNGGLLVGAVMLQRPELFRAVVCQVPLLDMRRYNHLLAGASWMDEYGDPDQPEDWAFIRRYSPYQNVAAGRVYPRVLFMTSTRDDRVHPAHARKMVAKMAAQGHDVLYYENIEGGHGGAANNEQAAQMWALSYTFLREQLF